MQCTVLEQAREVFDLLVSWGAPARLESDKDLLKVVATVVLSCLESRTGEAVAGVSSISLCWALHSSSALQQWMAVPRLTSPSMSPVGAGHSSRLA